LPGHTAGTVSMIFEVKDNGAADSRASGGTKFSFVNDVPFDTYINSARKFTPACRAGATV
jgi:hypothetical protein